MAARALIFMVEDDDVEMCVMVSKSKIARRSLRTTWYMQCDDLVTRTCSYDSHDLGLRGDARKMINRMARFKMRRFEVSHLASRFDASSLRPSVP